MSLDERLRGGLEGLDAFEEMPPDEVVESVLSRGRRHRWVRRIAAASVALAAAVAGLVVVPKVLDLEAGLPRPALPDAGEGIITTVAGTGVAWSSGDGGPATEASVAYPGWIGFDGAGNLYITESDIRVRKVDPSGVITTVVGSRAGGTATPIAPNVTGYGIAVDSAGSVYLWTEDALVRVASDGQVSEVARAGHEGCAGDGMLATEATLDPHYAGVAVDVDGSVYVTQFRDNCVRKIDTNGIISTIAGTGRSGFSGDGGSATEARLNGPSTVSVDGEGNIYISDAKNQRIRRVDTNGIITTVAGNGEPGLPEDGAVATEEPVGAADVYADTAGNIFITHEGAGSIFKVDRNGIITIVTGIGVGGYSGDGGPATKAQLSEPTYVAIGPDGDLYIADWGNNRIRKVDL